MYRKMYLYNLKTLCEHEFLCTFDVLAFIIKRLSFNNFCQLFMGMISINLIIWLL